MPPCATVEARALADGANPSAALPLLAEAVATAQRAAAKREEIGAQSLLGKALPLGAVAGHGLGW